MISLPEKVKIVEEQNGRAVFEFAPLYPGYGVTLGNALRRILLSSIQGAAITTVKIKDVSHEFSSMEGILEDVIEIIMNIKKIRLQNFSDEPVTLTLKVSGEKEVTAQDIKANSSVEIINKKQHIATLTDKKSSLEIEMIAERGVGYVPVEQRQKEKISVGTLAIDAIFSPVVNVNFTVENIRVEQRTDYNKLVMEIETDGTVSPKNALWKSVNILSDHLGTVRGGLEDAGAGEESMNQRLTESGEESKEKKTKKKKKE
ncbi:MAG: DNA-directed RNA polymerase subunit alpha [bacterium]|nr:DNA-directed RNA polymerase subunit alpha [bacterium]